MSELALQLIAQEKQEKTGRLDIGKCGLTELPNELFELDWLEELIVSNRWWDVWEQKWIESSNQGPNNQMQGKLGSEFRTLGKLKKLHCGGDYPFDHWIIEDLSTLAKLTTLQSLDLRNNEITDYSFLGKLKVLQNLDLSGQGITDTSSLKGLTTLQSLCVMNNQITNISSLSDLVNLRSLDISGNQITNIRPLAKLNSLQRIDLSVNRIVDISSLKELTNLQGLELRGNPLEDISSLKELKSLESLNLRGIPNRDISPLRELTSLRSLNLFDNRVSDISALKKLTSLLSLDLSGNRVIDISSLKNSNSLQELKLVANQITDISPLKKLRGLRSLDLSGNKIRDISFLENLTGLQSLDLSSNEITDILFLKMLINLRTLNLGNNPITDLTHLEELINLPYLKELKLYGIQENNLNIPPEQFGSSADDNCLENLRGYFASIKKGTTRTREVPVILVGNSTAGKTSLLEFVCHQRFPPQEDYSTHGIVPMVWKPDQTELGKLIDSSKEEAWQFYFWDFGGQEYYHATHRLFFSKQAIYVVLWEQRTNEPGIKKIEIRLKKPDGTIVESKLPVALFPYTYWLKSIRSFAQEQARAPVLLVQNKLDIEGNEEKDYPGGPFRQQYGIQGVFHLSLKNAFNSRPEGMPYLEYQQFFYALLSSAQQYSQTFARETFWEEIKEILRQRRTENIWTKAQFLAALQEIDPDIEEINLLSYGPSLQAMGFIFYYHHDPQLGNSVFINPEWVMEHIYGILDESVREKGGEFARDKVVQQLGKEYTDLFIALMKKFELIFENKEDSVYIAPQYLPSEYGNKKLLNFAKGSLPKKGKEASLIVYFPDFMPPSLIQRLIADLGELADNKIYWKYGGVFYLEDQTVLIESEPGERQLSFKVTDHDQTTLWVLFQLLREKTEQNDQLYVSLDNGKCFLKIANILEQENLGNKEAKVETLDGGICSIAGFLYLFNTRRPIRTSDMKSKNKVQKVFISYSHDDIAYRKELQEYLINLERDNIIEIWQDNLIEPGDKWDSKIKETLQQSDIIILLVSQKFIASNYVHEVEMKKALERVEAGEARIIPVLLKNCDWQAWKVLPENISEEAIEGEDRKGSIGSYQFFPMDEKQRLKPVNRWEYEEDVWTELAGYIRKMT